MIPYLGGPHFRLFHVPGWALIFFGALFLQQLVIGRRAAKLGLDPRTAEAFNFWVLFSGCIGSFIFKWSYRPDLLPLLLGLPGTAGHLIGGMSSFGGIGGAILGAWLTVKRWHMPGEKAWQYIDAVVWVFPFTWTLVRLGCFFEHDHPGIRSSMWLAVEYPGGSRFDLGLLEAIYSAGIAILFVILARRKHTAGFYFALFMILFGPYRIAQDALHIDPPRYLGITVDQYAGTAALLGGLLAAKSVRRRSAG